MSRILFQISTQRGNVRFGISLKLSLSSSYYVVTDYVFSKGDLGEV